MRFLIFIFILFLTACGLQPQALTKLPYQTLVLTTDNPYHPFSQYLSKHLQSTGIKILEKAEPEQEIYTLKLSELKERETSQVLQINPDIYSYQLRLQLDYKLQPPKAESIEKSITVYRYYDYDPHAILAREQEKAQLKESMYFELISLLINQLKYL